MDESEKTLRYLKGSGCIEFNNLDRLVPRSEAKNGTTMYFCCGMREKLNKRCSDDDIVSKKYFVVDIDIRLDHYNKNNGEVLDDYKIDNEIIKIFECLEKDKLDSFCASVRSGNGLHLYYTGTERSFDKIVYSEGVQYIYGLINKSLSPLGYSCDRACHNISRIMRIPGSINNRKKEKGDKILWDLGPTECNVIFFLEKDSELFENIEKYSAEYRKQSEEEKQDRIKIKEIISRDYKKGTGDIRKQINEIPACDIACDIRGVTVSDKGIDNVALREKHKNMGAYRYKPYNIIVNTGSSLIKTDKSCFTSYELVLHEMFAGDKTKTIEYFKSRYGIDTEKKTIYIPKIEYNKKGYVYGNSTFNDFECLMSGELVIICSETNSGKTTFAMDMLQKNAEIGKKGFYINLEFNIKTVAETRRLFLNNKTKKNLTDLEPLSYEEEQSKNKYVTHYLSKFDYYNNPQGLHIDELIEMILKKKEEGYLLFVVDTFSRIQGNLDSKISYTNQNQCMEKLQTLCQNTGVCTILLHHTNKKGEFEGSQKIKDLANVFITIKKEQGLGDKDYITVFSLSKDKFVTSQEIETIYKDKEYKKI